MTEQSRGEQFVIEQTSKLDQVREQLKQNPSVYCAGEVHNYSSASHWTQSVDMYVAPRKGLYKADELNKFMSSLVSIQPTQYDLARQYDPNDELYLGLLYFDESIGERTIHKRTETVLFEPLMTTALREAEVVPGVEENEYLEQLMRRTWLRVYPDTNAAQLSYQYQAGLQNGTIERNLIFDCLQFRIYPDQLRILQEENRKSGSLQGLISRIR